MPTIVTREYNPSTGALIGNVSQLAFGRTPVGSHTPIKVIDFAFSGVSSVDNVKVGLMSDGGITVNPSPPTGIDTDGSSSNGNFGIEHSTSFEVKTSLARHFAGKNTSDTSADAKNVLIETRDSTTSAYVYLEYMQEIAGNVAGNYKVFFDFT